MLVAELLCCLGPCVGSAASRLGVTWGGRVQQRQRGKRVLWVSGQSPHSNLPSPHQQCPRDPLSFSNKFFMSTWPRLCALTSLMLSTPSLVPCGILVLAVLAQSLPLWASPA